MGSPPAEELLKKIQELEAGQARLKQEMAKLMPGSAVSGDEDRRLRLRSLSASPRRSREPQGRRLSLGREHGRFGNYSSPLQRESLDLNPPSKESAMAGGRSSLRGGSIGLSERHHLQILQAMGQSIHISDVEGRIIFWNRSAEHLYGFSATEALGQKATELLVDPCNFDLAAEIESRVLKWGSWSGKLPVKNKREEEFVAMATITPFYDDVDKKLIGMICVSCNSQYFQESSSSSPASSFIGESGPGQTRFSLRSKVSSGSQQPLQATIASKLSNLAIKVTNKGRLRTKGTSEGLERETAAVNGCSDTVSLDQREDGASSGASTPRGDSPSCSFTVPRKAAEVNSEETEGKMGIHKMISAKAEAWIAKKSLSWPWKGQEHEADETKNRFVWPWLQHDPENESSLSKNAESSMRQDNQPFETTRVGNNEATGSWSSSVSSNGSTSSSAVQKLDLESDCLDYEILWEDLVIGEQIGQGSCGTVYHALWYGSDVAVKVFSKMEYSEEVISSFKQEVSLMKRLRHPNILLFMGSVTSPQRLCIVTEFLPRGSLFRLLQRATTKLDRRRRVNMALDIARGVNYLHHCNPPIFHRDLKSSNLLVDKNWTVKVGDFGLSRLKRETYLTSNTGKGTPQWMAPEVLRNEHADEKSDVYSYGVVLWELVTEKIPWDNLNSMQVIGAVGFMNQRLEFPEDLDPRWVSIISSCWHSEPNLRPTFQELIEKLKDLQRHYSLQSQLQRSSLGGNRKPPSE